MCCDDGACDASDRGRLRAQLSSGLPYRLAGCSLCSSMKHFLCNSRDSQSACALPPWRAAPTATSGLRQRRQSPRGLLAAPDIWIGRSRPSKSGNGNGLFTAGKERASLACLSRLSPEEPGRRLLHKTRLCACHVSPCPRHFSFSNRFFFGLLRFTALSASFE